VLEKLNTPDRKDLFFPDHDKSLKIKRIHRGVLPLSRNFISEIQTLIYKKTKFNSAEVKPQEVRILLGIIIDNRQF
jgi:hypothetical protein